MIGQNCFTETEDSPLTVGEDGGILTPDPEVERERIEALEQWKAERDDEAVEAALADARRGRRGRVREPDAGDDRGRQGRRRPPASGRRRCASVFGAYRGPTGVDGSATGGDAELLAEARGRSRGVASAIGHRIRILVAKPGLDGHSNGAEQIAVRARDVGMEVVYQGIRLTPEEIAASRRRRRTSTSSGSRSSPAPTASSSRGSSS